MSGIGGSSGALFGTFFMSMAKTPDLDGNINFNKACEMVITGINAMKERGKADVGEKMIDFRIHHLRKPLSKFDRFGIRTTRVS